MRSDYTLADLEQKYIRNFPEDDSYDYIYGIDKTRKQYANELKQKQHKLSNCRRYVNEIKNSVKKKNKNVHQKE